MRKRSTRNQTVILLAYLHRYVYPIMVFVIAGLIEGYVLLGLGIGFLLFALYSLVGYILRWDHIYCSYQNMNHMEMTPDIIQWDKIEKSDAFGIPAIFGFFGVAEIIVYFCSL